MGPVREPGGPIRELRGPMRELEGPMIELGGPLKGLRGPRREPQASRGPQKLGGYMRAGTAPEGAGRASEAL